MVAPQIPKGTSQHNLEMCVISTYFYHYSIFFNSFRWHIKWNTSFFRNSPEYPSICLV